MVTVFTPTYNRAYILPKLYESLCFQTSKDFEWVIVDDGSTDDTESLAEQWISEKEVPIVYKKIENCGKSNAINVGIRMASGNLFFIVDSDDYLTNDAVERVLSASSETSELDKICGVCFKRFNLATNTPFNTPLAEKVQYASSLELTYKYRQTGDKAEVFYSDVLKQFPFPSISGCKFIPEALVWNRISAAGYRFLIKDDPIYMCEYIEDGYTNNFKANLRKNSKGFALYYKECLKYKEVPFIVKIKSLIRYLQCQWYGVRSK